MHYDTENKIIKTGRGRKSHQWGKSAALASLHIPPSPAAATLPLLRARPGPSSAGPKHGGPARLRWLRGLAPSPHRLCGFYFRNFKFIFSAPPASGWTGGAPGDESGAAPRLREQRPVPGQHRSGSAAAGQVPRWPSDRTGGEIPLPKKKLNN